MTIIEKLLTHKTPLTPQEAAEYLGLNERTVRRWLGLGRLKGYRPDGENWRLDPAHLAAYINECGNW
jgi:excisionase family DNA binding protein